MSDKNKTDTVLKEKNTHQSGTDYEEASQEVLPELPPQKGFRYRA